MNNQKNKRLDKNPKSYKPRADKINNLYVFPPTGEGVKDRFVYESGRGGKWTDELTAAERMHLISEINGKNGGDSFDPLTSYKRLSDTILESLKHYDHKDISEAWRLGNDNMKAHWDEVNSLILKERAHRRVTGKEGNKSPWTKIPNVSDAKIIMGVETPGLERRIGTRMESIPYKNAKLNKYLTHQVRQLEKNRGKPTYWVIAERLIRKSLVFRLAAINHVYPTWYKTMKYPQLLDLIRTLEAVATTPATPMSNKRFYVRKANGKLRPIGAPDPVWRIILHQTNCILEWFYEPHFGDEQHAYRPGKGSGTAWRSIIKKKILASPYVYEYDLKGFFDNVKVEPIMAELNRLGMPTRWTDAIQVWHSAKPYPASWLESDMIEEYNKEIKERNWKNWESQSDSGFIPDEHKPWLTGKLHKISFAQGSPMAPTLSIIGKELWLRRMKEKNPGSTWVIYADDGIVASPEPIELEDAPDLGIIQAREKSSYVKYESVWRHNLQFLGLNYEYVTGKIKINTRSGIQLTPSEEELRTILTMRKNMMPQLMKKGEVENWKPLEPRSLKVNPPLPWKAYHIHKNVKMEDGMGGFGVSMWDSWSFKKSEADETRGYFEWMPEVRPEVYSGDIELTQLSQTRLWDWYYSRGFNAARRKTERILTWDSSSTLIYGIMKRKRRYEPVLKTLLNASSVSNWRLLKMLGRERTRRRYDQDQPFKVKRGVMTLWDPKGSILDKSWLPKASAYESESHLWANLKAQAMSTHRRRKPMVEETYEKGSAMDLLSNPSLRLRFNEARKSPAGQLLGDWNKILTPDKEEAIKTLRRLNKERGDDLDDQADKPKS